MLTIGVLPYPGGVAAVIDYHSDSIMKLVDVVRFAPDKYSHPVVHARKCIDRLDVRPKPGGTAAVISVTYRPAALSGFAYCQGQWDGAFEMAALMSGCELFHATPGDWKPEFRRLVKEKYGITATEQGNILSKLITKDIVDVSETDYTADATEAICLAIYTAIKG